MYSILNVGSKIEMTSFMKSTNVIKCSLLLNEKTISECIAMEETRNVESISVQCKDYPMLFFNIYLNIVLTTCQTTEINST